MMRRRDLIAMLGGAAAGWPTLAHAQGAMPMIGYLGFTSPGQIGARLTAFQDGLKERGYIVGQNLKVEYRWGEGQAERIPAFAAELVRLRVAAIVAPGTADAAMAATKTIPPVGPASAPTAHWARTRHLAPSRQVP